jgi:hypothetical protein
MQHAETAERIIGTVESKKREEITDRKLGFDNTNSSVCSMRQLPAERIIGTVESKKREERIGRK